MSEQQLSKILICNKQKWILISIECDKMVSKYFGDFVLISLKINCSANNILNSSFHLAMGGVSLRMSCIFFQKGYKETGLIALTIFLEFYFLFTLF